MDRKLVVELNPALRNQWSFVRSDGMGFWEFLDKSKIKYKKEDFPFLTSHKVPQVLPVFNFDEFMSLSSRGEALAYLYKGFGKSLNYVGPVLDHDLEFGFNDHTDRHTLWVAQTATELLGRAGKNYNGKRFFDEKTEALATLVAMTHDLGNFIDRKEHSTYSAWLLTRLFTRSKKHKKEWDAVMETILFHEEPVLLAMKLPLSKLKPLHWALVAADKMHGGRERVGGRSIEKGIKQRAFENDRHILLNALIARSSWHLAGGLFVYHLDFSIDQLTDKFAAFSKGNGRIWVPKQFQDLFLRSGKKYRDSFAEMFSAVYGPRMKIATEAIFLLFPFVQKFEVILHDTDTRNKVGSGMVRVFGVKRA
jgi:hypothetical protein